MIRIGLFSNLNLEYKFRRMSISLEEKYRNHQMRHINKIINIVKSESLDLLVIAGNIFGKIRPSNMAIKFFGDILDNICRTGASVILVPGTHETPLWTTNDSLALDIYQDKPNVHLLNINYDHNKEIIKPFCELELKGTIFHFFGVLNPLERPNEYEYSLDLQEPAHSFFILHDLINYKTDITAMAQEFLHKLDENPIIATIIGGSLPTDISPEDYETKIICAPIIHPDSFDFQENTALGLKIIEYDPSNYDFLEETEKIIPISDFSVFKVEVNLEEIAPDKWNEVIRTLLKEKRSTQTFMKLVIKGVVKRDDYHEHLKTFKYMEQGQNWNFYFEYDDQVEFDELTAGIEDLNFIEVMKGFVQKKIKEPKSQKFHSKYYKKAMAKIEEDYKELF